LLEPDRLREGAIALAKKYLFDGVINKSTSSEEESAERERNLLSQATASFSEVRLKDEMAAVVRERNLMQAELRASAGAMARVEASSKRAAVVRVAENTFMIDECNRLRRENLQAKRDQIGLERLVAAFGGSSQGFTIKADSSLMNTSSSVDGSLPSTMVPGFAQQSVNEEMSLSASTVQPMGTSNAVEDEDMINIATLPSMPEAPPLHKSEKKSASILPIIRPPNAPAPVMQAKHKKRPKVPTTLKGSINALAALEMEGDELVYALQKTRMTIAAQQAELEELRRAAHGIPSLRPQQMEAAPPSSSWLDDEKSESTRTLRMGNGAAAEEGSVLSFTSSLSPLHNEMTKKVDRLMY
jgi:hypothetical protein